jgi:hypothetical protein
VNTCGDGNLRIALYQFKHMRVFVHIYGYAQHVLNAGSEAALDKTVEIIFEIIELDAIEMAV